MIKINKDFPRSAIFTLGLGLGICLVILPLTSKIDRIISAQDDAYGEALVQATAREAVEAAFQQDLISLSAILESVVSSPKVQQAAIHSVEGRIMVQAGKDQFQEDKRANAFQATISLQDSVAGVVTLKTTPTNWSSLLSSRLYLAIATLSFLFSAFITYVNGTFSLKQFRSAKFNSESISTPDDQNAELASDAFLDEPEEAAISEPAFATLCIKNIATLQQQLSGDSFRTTFRKLESKLNHISQLYGAVECHWERDRYFIEYRAAKPEDALFNAACATRLMLDLAGITNRIPLDLSGQISLARENTLVDDMPFVGLAVHQAQDAFAMIEDRVELLELGDNLGSRRIISIFFQPYDELLKNQTSQLSEQFEQLSH